jgi:D-aminopeptidase
MNGNPLAEVVLFAASLAPYAVQPLFFSGCAVACAQAKAAITGIHTYPIDKSTGPETFDVDSWRSGLAKAAVESLNIEAVQPYEVEGPFKAVLEIRDDKDLARKIATRWGFAHEGSLICIEATDMHHLYGELIKLCYLTPFREKILPLALLLNNLKGRLGLHWVRRRVRGYAPVENL